MLSAFHPRAFRLRLLLAWIHLPREITKYSRASPFYSVLGIDFVSPPIALFRIAFQQCLFLLRFRLSTLLRLRQQSFLRLTMEDSVDQASSLRRERLRALRAAKEYASMPDVDGDIIQNGVSKSEFEADGLEEKAAPSLKFRNYLPHDKHLQEGKLDPIDLPKFQDPVAALQPPSEKIEDPFVNIAPKKPNWDLRRDVQKKLDKLERRTQKALYELMLEQEKVKAMELENAGE